MINWDVFKDLWESFGEFLDRLFLWLEFVLGKIDTWPGEQLPEEDQ